MELGENPIYHVPNVKAALKYPFSNNNNAHSITKYGVLGQLDVQIVALRLVHPLKGHRWGTGQKKMPGALTLPLRCCGTTKARLGERGVPGIPIHTTQTTRMM